MNKIIDVNLVLYEERSSEGGELLTALSFTMTIIHYGSKLPIAES